MPEGTIVTGKEKEIQAIKIDAKFLTIICEKKAEIENFWADIGWNKITRQILHVSMACDTPAGRVPAKIGDFLVRDEEQGTLYPVRPELFHRTFREV